MALTPDGKLLYRSTRADARTEGIRQISTSEEIVAGDLRVMVGDITGIQNARGLKTVQVKAPKVRLSLQSVNCYVIRDSLFNDNTDLGVFYRVGHDEALQMEYFGQQEISTCCIPAIP